MIIQKILWKLKKFEMTSSKNQKTKFTPTRFIILKTVKCVNPEVAERVDALNQSLQQVLREETSFSSIDFNENLIPQSLAKNIFCGRGAIHLAFAGYKQIINVSLGYIGNNQARVTMK